MLALVVLWLGAAVAIAEEKGRVRLLETWRGALPVPGAGDDTSETDVHLGRGGLGWKKQLAGRR